jgi:hypothetical protein
MADNGTDFEIFENEDIEGRVFLQFLSGESTNQFRLECLPQLCTLRGRVKLVRGNAALYENYEFALDQATEFQISPMSLKELPVDIPPSLTIGRATLLTARGFPYHLPVDSVRIVLVSGDAMLHSDDAASGTDHPVALMKAIIEYRKTSVITVPAALRGYSVEEVLFDKLTLLRGRLAIPQPHGFNVDVVLDPSTPTSQRPSPWSSPRSPSTHRAVSASRTEHSVNGIGGLWRQLSLRSLAVESFIYILVLLIWLLVRSYHLTAENYHRFTIYTVLVVAVAGVAIFSFRGYTMKLLSRTLTTTESNGRSMFVNGWNAWSFCGSVPQGQRAPIYSMPGLFVRAFHDGGAGTALRINLGQGDGPPPPAVSKDKDHGTKTGAWSMRQWWGRGENNAAREAARDYIASDMFTLISEARAGYGVVVGFLSQRHQFGCIAANRTYDRVSIHTSGDGTVVASSANNFSRTIETDWLCLYTVSGVVDEPFKVYMALSSAENKVHEKVACVRPPRTPPASPLASLRLPEGVDAQFSPTDTTAGALRSAFICDGEELLSPTLTTADCVVEAALDPSSAMFDTILDRQLQSAAEGGSYGGGLAPFLPALSPPQSRPHRLRKLGDAMPAGWCSWYHFYERISQTVLATNLAFMERFRVRHRLHHDRQNFRLFQVDDGYQAAWGDWALLDKVKFPSLSLFTLVDAVKAAGLTPGLWFAPFACDKHSRVAKQHPAWILKRDGSRGVPANSANCGKFFYGLDTTHPDVQQHIRASVEVAKTLWGFQYLKLDFLYSAVLADAHDSHFDRTLTNAEIMQQAMRLISDCAGQDMFLLACGAPLGGVIGHVHSNRVSAGKLIWFALYRAIRSQFAWTQH